MRHLVEKYSANLPIHDPSLLNPAKDTVLLTGSTGALGAELLAKLVISPDIERVYAVNRGGVVGTKERQLSVMVERGLNESLVDSPKVVFAEMDITKDGLGLRGDLLDEASQCSL